jgi:hypothetical protein
VKIRRLASASVVFVLAATSALAGEAQATIPTRTFNNSVAVWSEPNAWSPTGVPQNGESIELPAGGSYFDVSGLSIQDLVVTPPHAIAAAESSLRINGNIEVRAGTASGQLFDAGGWPTIDLPAGVHTVSVAAESQAFLGRLTGAGSIRKSGQGLAGLRGDFTGPIDVIDGGIAGCFGSITSATTLRAGTSATGSGDCLTEPFTVYSGTEESPTILHVARSGDITTVGDGIVDIRGGVIEGSITGPALIRFTSLANFSNAFIGTNTYTGGTVINDKSGLEVGGTSPLGTGPVLLAGSTVNNAQLSLRPGSSVSNDVTVGFGRLILSDDGVADPPELAGQLVLNADTPLWASGDDAIAVLSGPITGPGHLLIQPSVSPRTFVFAGDEGNTNSGITVQGDKATLLLAKPDGVTAISGSLDGPWAADVVWLGDEQVSDGADVRIDGSMQLQGATETIRSLDLRGALALGAHNPSFAPGTLRVSNLSATEHAEFSIASDGTATDRIEVSDRLSLSKAQLDVTAMAGGSDRPITLISVESSRPVEGTFAGLPEGAGVAVGTRTMRITYQGGDGNDVVLRPDSPPEPPAGSSFAALVPGRLLDSRIPASPTVDGQFQAIGIRPTGSITELQVTGRHGVPSDAAAVSLNVTALGAPTPGFVTVWPCGTPQPNASNLNYNSGPPIPNAVLTRIGTGGKICLYTETATHLIVDVNGHFPAGSSFAALVPGRLLDSRIPASPTVDGQFQAIGIRPTGSITELQVTGRHGVPSDAAAVSLNVTALGAPTPGFVTVWPCGTPQPNASNLNYNSGQPIPNAVLTRIGTGGKICLYTETATHLIVDINGHFP